jgi:hypothetical protein
MLSQRQIQSSNPMQFKTQEIEESLKSNGVYKKDSFIIKQLIDFDQYRQEEEYVPAEEDFVFALQNTNPETPFLGVVNYSFKREGYCLNVYENRDIYFGYYKNDLRNKQGIYSYCPTKDDTYLYTQFYYGLWENDLCNGFGLYLWLKERIDTIPFSDFNNANFEAFVGESAEGLFKKGALLSKEGKNTFIYYGTFSEEGQKEGNKCFYYCTSLERICYGTFSNGKFIEGYVGNFNKDGKLSDLIIFKKEEGKKAVAEKIKINNQQKISNILTNFRKVVLSKDYFNKIYDEFGKILKTRDEKMNTIDIFFTDEYEKIMNAFQFNKITLCQDIEKYIDL